MDPQEEIAPKRSELWFGESVNDRFYGRLLDRTAIVVCIALALFSFAVFWPIISKITLEEIFYTPLAPFLMGILGFFGIVPEESIRILLISSFCTSVVGVYLLVRYLTKRHVTSILAALIYLMPPVPVFVLTYLRQGLYQKELDAAKDFFTVIYGDGAHFLGLALLPFVILFLLRYLKTGRKGAFVATILLCALVFLSNRSATLALLLILAAVAVTEFFLGFARVKIKRFIHVVLISLGLVSFWYTPTFMVASLLLYKGQLVENLRFFLPLPLILTILGMFFCFVFFARHARRQPIFVFFLLLIIFSVVILEWLATGHSLVPHPQRIFANFNMFLAIVLALGLSAVFDKFEIENQMNVAGWSTSGRTLAALVFGFVSFLILSAFAFLFSPFAVLFLTGPEGVWTKISAQVLAERQQALAMVGENFKLVRLDSGNLQTILGVMLTAISILVLFYLVFGEEEEGE